MPHKTWEDLRDEGHPRFVLSKLSTEELLHYLQQARRYGGGADPLDDHKPQYVISIEAIRKELATRDHRPLEGGGKEKSEGQAEAGPSKGQAGSLRDPPPTSESTPSPAR